MCSVRVSQTEDEFIVTFTVEAPPWITVAPGVAITAITSRVFVRTIAVTVGPDFQLVIGTTLQNILSVIIYLNL